MQLLSCVLSLAGSQHATASRDRFGVQCRCTAVNDMEFFTVLDQQGVATRQQPSTIA